MAKYSSDSQELRPAGYLALIRGSGLEVIPNWHESLVAISGTHRILANEDRVREIYPPSYWPGDSPGAQLEFALKYDGTNLGILASLFPVLNLDEFTAYIRSKPIGKYARRLWYLYEWLTGDRLDLDDLKRGNYIPLLEPEKYYTISPAQPVRRQRLQDNLLGDAQFCPVVRRSKTLQYFESLDFQQRCQQVTTAYAPELLKRAMTYLYTKETKSSFEIEHIKPGPSRAERFIALLQLARQEDFCDKPHLIELQNRIVDSRFREKDYRTRQNYVGQTVAWQQEKVHLACPKPEDLTDLMEGLTTAHRRIHNSEVSPVIHAAAVAYGFVFLHPFEDGNGRIHRFLIHNILACRGFTPTGIMFPISATMLKHPVDYDASLEAFSKPLMSLVDYSLDSEGQMTVHNDTARWYRYIDMTAQAEALYAFIKKTIDVELVEELTFLANYDRTKTAIQEIVDMPDRQIDLFIRFCLQNNGRLSARKRTGHFTSLTDEEIARMEQAVQSSYGQTPGDA